MSMEDEEHQIEVDGDSKPAPHLRLRHIKKRALKNKALSVSFNEKDLRDFVTGFHKRKKKRRKEAQKKQEEALRRKRIEERKKRKQERELALYDGVPPSTNTEPDESDEPLENDEDIEPPVSTSGMTVYDSGDMKVTVTTSEISRKEETGLIEKIWTKNTTGGETDKRHSVPVNNRKSFKRVTKKKPHRKKQNRRATNRGGKEKNH